jgi:hypothetical protein
VVQRKEILIHLVTIHLPAAKQLLFSVPPAAVLTQPTPGTDQGRDSQHLSIKLDEEFLTISFVKLNCSGIIRTHFSHDLNLTGLFQFCESLAAAFFCE